MIDTLRDVCIDLQVDGSAIYPQVDAAFFDYKIDGGPFWSVKTHGEEQEIWFKNSVQAMTFADVAAAVPKLSTISWKDLEIIPYFTHDLELIREASETGRPIAIEGGPCLFGGWEVFMDLYLDDGTVIAYDFNTSDRVVGDDYDLEAPLLSDAVEQLKDRIVDIQFRDVKDGLTGQEYYSVLYLFEAARALDARVILSLPDMSYVKFLSAVVAQLSEELQAKTLARFREVAYRITDLYIELARKLSADYPEVVYQPVHERLTDIIETYYEKRTPYIERNKVLRHISRYPVKLESLKDYISLSALPYYLYGITDVLHICSLDESDSYRKCRKAHKGHLNLACILYPEYISPDGENTVFYAKKQYKDYVTY